MYLIAFISWLNEIWTVGPTASIIILTLLLLFLILFFVIWLRSWSESYDTKVSYFREFFSGIKSTRISRVYFSTFLLRRVFSILIAVSLSNSSVYLQTSLFALPNILCLWYSAGIRPFDSIKDNIVEVLNDFSFGVFWTMMIYRNTLCHSTSKKLTLWTLSIGENEKGQQNIFWNIILIFLSNFIKIK